MDHCGLLELGVGHCGSFLTLICIRLRGQPFLLRIKINGESSLFYFAKNFLSNVLEIVALQVFRGKAHPDPKFHLTAFKFQHNISLFKSL